MVIMESGEAYLGGVASPHMIRGRMRGYELHATDKRLIGIKNHKIGAGWMLGAGLGGAIGGAIAGRAGQGQYSRTIQDLDARKDFEARKDEIQAIELKKPGLLVGGHVRIVLKSGDSVEIKIGDKPSYEKTITLVQSFYPEVVKLPPS